MIALPDEFIKKYTHLLEDDAKSFFESFDHNAKKAYRINPLKNNTELFDTANDGNLPYGIWGRFGEVSGHSVDHVTGVVYSQEPSAQFVGEVVQPSPGERILDLSAAPGGKSTHLASFMDQSGLLWSNEIFMSRAKILSENIERMGIRNAIVTSHSPAELSEKLPNFFDKILLDAPCSGEGMFRKNQLAINQWHKDFPKELATLQKEILIEALKMLKPGGQIVYSTCTFSPEEDEQTISWLLKTYPELILLKIDKPSESHISDGVPEWSDKQYTDGRVEISNTSDQKILLNTARLWPHKLQGEGHFVAKLQKEHSETDLKPNKAIKKLESSNLSNSQKRLLDEFFVSTMTNFEVDYQRLVLFGDRLYMAPEDTPNLNGMKILRLGLEIGVFKKNRFEPSHALALAFSPQKFKQQFNLNEDDWVKYVHGDVLRTKQRLNKGWILVTANENGVGWGKFVDGQIKNFFPKGLRF